jgi:hypothetical protein
MNRRTIRQDHGVQLEMMFEEPLPSGANLSSDVFDGGRDGWAPFSTWAISVPAYRNGARNDADREG